MKTNTLTIVMTILTMILVSLPTYTQIVQVGKGSYTTTFPGIANDGRNGYPSGTPFLSGEAATKPVPTNDWWSDMIKTAHGGKAFNYPLSFRSQNSGLNINYTVPQLSTAREYVHPIDEHRAVVVGLDGLNTSNSTVSDHSDWSITMNWNNQFYSTVNIGSPFVYFEKKNTAARARITINYNPNGVSIQGNKLIIQNNINGSDYVVFAPSGATWTGANGVYTSNLNGKNYWSMVLLPTLDDRDIQSTIIDYEQYAYVFPKDTRVDWDYNETTSKVRTTFTITPEVKEGSRTKVLQGLLPHQWDRLASDSPQLKGDKYFSVRGTIKTLVGNRFVVENTFSGILPTLPNLGSNTEGFDLSVLESGVNQIKNEQLTTWTDSYNQGQDMNRLIQAARIADQIGNIQARDQLINTVKERLEDWLSAENGEKSFIFYYNSDWSALIGYPAGHSQDTNLNDHHFHWGYFIHAAAAIEQYNPGWASQWGDMINMLVKDAANPSRDDTMFPFLRNFSPYAGHSWANGFSTIHLGNDQESTSESMQFNSALIHWGEITNNRAIRDLGIYLYTTEQSTIEEYWFDVEERSFQPEFEYEMVARLWAGGYDNLTWWTQDVSAAYGIQLYPIHGGSLYLGHRTDYVDRVWQEMTENTQVLQNIQNNNLWYDTYWKFLSLTDPDRALELYRSYPNRIIKHGISDVQTYHWLHNMASLGEVANEITADYPIAAAFNKDGVITYVAHNYSTTNITVRFSNGFNLSVPANTMATATSEDDPDGNTGEENQEPFFGVPITLPGIFEAGHYDINTAGNAQGITYNDSDVVNHGDYRSNEGVDVKNQSIEGTTIGWTMPGEWVEYTVNVLEAGSYTINMRYASGSANGGGPFWFEQGGSKISEDIRVPSTGGWDQWKNHIVENIMLEAGEQVIRVHIDAGGFDFGRMTFELTEVTDSGPVVAAPNPTEPSSKVISLFSDSYDDVIVDTWRTSWSQSKYEEVMIDGNSTKKYTELNYVGIETISNQIDINKMEYLSLDVWSNDFTEFRVKLVDFGPDREYGGGDDKEYQLTYTPDKRRWVRINIPITSFTGLTTKANIAQLILSAAPTGNSTVFIDNLYFYTNQQVSSPLAAAPIPEHANSDVISLFSEKYNDVQVDTWKAVWSNSRYEQINISGNATKKYTDLEYVGVEVVNQQLDITEMTHFRTDIWSQDYTNFKIKLVDFGPNAMYGGGDDVEHEITIDSPVKGQWVHIDIPISSFTGLTTKSNIAQLIYSGNLSGSKTVYLDNVYFYKEQSNVHSANDVISDNKESADKTFVISTYPNPMYNIITINGISNMREIKFYNTVGKLVLKKAIGKNDDQLSIDVQGLSKGLYFVRVVGNKTTTVHKVLKK